MEPGEALGIAAQVAVALAGFAGVVVVFRREAVHEWSSIDKLRLRLLLANSILPLSLSMVGLVLLTVEPMPQGIWKWCSGLLLIATISFVTASMKSFPAFEYRESAEPARHAIHVLLIRVFWHGSHVFAIV